MAVITMGSVRTGRTVRGVIFIYFLVRYVFVSSYIFFLVEHNYCLTCFCTSLSDISQIQGSRGEERHLACQLTSQV